MFFSNFVLQGLFDKEFNKMLAKRTIY